MSISSAPASTASWVSASRAAVPARPAGNPVATAATAIGRLWGTRLRDQRTHLAGSVGTLQGGQVDHRDHRVQPPGLRGRLARPGTELGGPAGQADRIHSAQPVHERAPRAVAPLVRADGAARVRARLVW